MRVSDLQQFLSDLPEAVKRVNPEITLWLPNENIEYGIDDIDYDAHGKPPVWVTISAQKAKYEREDWFPTDKKKKERKAS